jgi:hypothetical protein
MKYVGLKNRSDRRDARYILPSFIPDREEKIP